MNRSNLSQSARDFHVFAVVLKEKRHSREQPRLKQHPVSEGMNQSGKTGESRCVPFQTTCALGAEEWWGQRGLASGTSLCLEEGVALIDCTFKCKHVSHAA